MTRRISSRGFTLIELLVALAIFSGMLVMLYQSMFTAQRATAGVEESLTRLHEMRMTMDVMRRELESALASTDNKDKPGITLVGKEFYGAPATECSFTTFHTPGGGEMSVRYYVEETADRQLILYKKTSKPWKPVEDAEPAEIIEGLGSILIEVKDNDKWVSTWSGPTESAVRITITTKINDRDVTLQETVQPMIGRAL